MTFTKILCPIDFSPGAERALRMATRLATDANAELVVAHASYIPASAHSLDALLPPHVIQGIADDARRRLDEAVGDATAAGAKHATAMLLSGVPWAAIVGQLERQPFDLCVIGTHGRTGLARILMGSVADKVVRHAPCAVLAVRPDGEVKPFAHVVVPTDFSDDAQHALELAPKLVAPQGSITLLHVIDTRVVCPDTIPISDFARDLDVRAALALDGVAKSLRASTAVPISTSSRAGYPGAEILAALDDDATIDLVVMGSHGRTGIQRALMGSVAEKIVRHARCPVLVARKRR